MPPEFPFLDLPMEGKLINLIESFALLVTIWSVSGRTPFMLIRMFRIQSFLLAAGTLLIAHATGIHHLFYAAGFTLGFKVILIPLVLNFLARRIEHRTTPSEYLNVPSSLILSSFFTVIGFTTATSLVNPGGTFSAPWILAVAISVMLIGVFLMVNHRNTLNQILGLMLMENGVFLAAIAITYGVPLLIEFGIFFDVFVGILIMAILLFKIHTNEKGLQIGGGST